MMSMFRYEAADKSGKVLRGAMEARTEDEVRQRLDRMGYSVRAITSTAPPRPARQPRTAPDSTAPGIARVTLPNGTPVSVASVVPPSVLALFFRQLATLVRSAVPLSQSISGLAATVPNNALRQAVRHIEENILAGESISKAMSEYPFVFPVHTIAAVWCGELSGRLDVSLDEIATDCERERAENRVARTGWIVFKAQLLSTAFAAPFTNLATLLQPVISDASTNRSMSENLMAIAMGAIKTSLPKGLTYCAVLIAIWIAWGWIKRIPVVRNTLDGILINIPVWGKLHRYRGLARFYQYISWMVNAGLPAGTSWDAASLTPRVSSIAADLRAAKAKIGAGGNLPTWSSASQMIALEDQGAIATGDSAGSLPAMLENLAQSYKIMAEAQRGVGLATSNTIFWTSLIILSGYLIIQMVASYGPILEQMGLF